MNDQKTEQKHWFRIEDQAYSLGCDEFGDPYPGHTMELTCYRLPLIKETPKGAWVDYYGKNRWVKMSAKKRFACPTFEEAIESYKARKNRQISILRSRIKDVEECLFKLQFLRKP